MSRCTLGWIDLRCRDIKHSPLLPFGGMNIIILGDDSQIRSIETPLYDKYKKKNDQSNQGLEAYKHFKDVVFLDQMMRQEYEEPIPNDIDFKEKTDQKNFCKMLSERLHEFK